MGFTSWLDGIVQKMRWYDISLVKFATFFFTLFLIVVWPGFRELVLGIEWYWYLAATFVVSIPILRKMF